MVTDAEGARRLAALRDQLPDLAAILCTQGAQHGAEDLRAACAERPEPFPCLDTAADDPAFLIYTSRHDRARPRGRCTPTGCCWATCRGSRCSHDFLPQPGDRIWTPADWAWIGGLLDVLLPALHHGVPVVARRLRQVRRRGDAFRLMADHGVRNAFLPPTALKMMRAGRRPAAACRCARSASGGETLGAELLDWGREVFGCTINEFYGQTECNLIVVELRRPRSPAEPGAMGRAVPGHEVAVVDAAGRPVARRDGGRDRRARGPTR